MDKRHSTDRKWERKDEGENWNERRAQAKT
jgi:hypothetical protein